MTTAGWIFMIASLGFVWSLVGWCYYHILTAPKPRTEDDVPKPVKDFHSA